MLGAIFGDIAGSLYERVNMKSKDFPLLNPDAYFTDDTVHTVALAYSILEDKPYSIVLKQFYHRYPSKGYGGKFHVWDNTEDAKPYNSFGNGSAIRTSAVAYAYQTLDDVLHYAEVNAAVTHSHLEGIKGAQATARAIYLARTGKSKQEIKIFIEESFDYNLSQTLDEIPKFGRHYEPESLDQIMPWGLTEKFPC